MDKALLLLGFDTSSPMASIALAEDEKILAELTLPIERSHMEKLIPGLQQVLAKARRSMRQIEGVVVGIGPGSFTGTRIGVVVGKTLAQVLKIPIVGVPSLDVLAFQARGEGDFITAVIDAKREQVYTGSYHWRDCELERQGGYRALDPKFLAKELAESGQKVVLVGDGIEKYLKVFSSNLRAQLVLSPKNYWHPKASSLIFLAQEAIRRAKWDDLFQLIPMYIRPPDIRGK